MCSLSDGFLSTNFHFVISSTTNHLGKQDVTSKTIHSIYYCRNRLVYPHNIIESRSNNQPIVWLNVTSIEIHQENGKLNKNFTRQWVWKLRTKKMVLPMNVLLNCTIISNRKSNILLNTLHFEWLHSTEYLFLLSVCLFVIRFRSVCENEKCKYYTHTTARTIRE